MARKTFKCVPYEQIMARSWKRCLAEKKTWLVNWGLFLWEVVSPQSMWCSERESAANCIIHWLGKQALRLDDLVLRCFHLDLLLQFLMSSGDSSPTGQAALLFCNYDILYIFICYKMDMLTTIKTIVMLFKAQLWICFNLSFRDLLWL